MFLKFADVALNIPFQDRDSLTYIIPKSMEKNISVGVRVEVPLKARKVEGTVIEIHSSEPSYPVKEILKLVDKTPVVTEEQIELAFWMKDMYLASLGECLYKMVPGGRRKKNIKNLGVEVEANLLNLNSEQEIAFKNIYSCFGKESSHLLYGVTGSGKTEVYIHLIHKLLEETDKSAIYLVPEISLTVQTLRRLQIIFGDELAILHSALRISDRYNTYLQILKGEKRIVVGTRSAIFSPVQNLGLVIIDEEHDSSYKEHSSPRYHARQVAMQRCKTHSAVLLMGTATPSVELYYHATKGAVHLHVLKNRAKASSLSEITISENKDKKKILGDNLLFEVKKRLERQEQCILLLNRRGYSPLLYIKEQKKFLECPNCTANLCYHKKGTAICHLCGFSESLNDLKKDYGPDGIEMIGAGTQKLEEFLLEKFPSARIERLDQDVTKNKEILTEVIGRLIDGEIDILTGTQMISKGLDASKVTLVGVVNANIGLGLPDFRAGERVFSLLTQVAGRAGRSELKGQVIIETTNANHPVIQLACTQNYENFYQNEIHARYHTFYPPYSRLVRLLCRSKSEEKSQETCDKLKLALEKKLETLKGTNTILLGPAPCPFYKIDTNFRNHIIFKTNALNQLRNLIREVVYPFNLPSNVYIEIDIDPVDLV